MKNNCFFFFGIFLRLKFVSAFEPFSIGAITVGGFAAYKALKAYTYCSLTECCDEHSIPGDIDGFEKLLDETVFGQHIAQEIISGALRAHFHSAGKSHKPLVISFHGTPGTGKNFLTKHIAEKLYKEGFNSKYVHRFMGRSDFPRSDAENVAKYKTQISDIVRESIKSCPRSLFIFDEVDKMPAGIFDSIASILEYNALSKGLNNTQAIFIFLTNSGGPEIASKLGSLIKGGTLRTHSKLSDFELLLQTAAFNDIGGLFKTSLIESFIIDHYVPFLPLEKSHVKDCIRAEFKHWNINPPDYDLEDIIRNKAVYDPEFGIFVTTGCKTIEKTVAARANNNNNRKFKFDKS